MTVRTIWFFGFSVFVLLVFVALSALARATPATFGERLAAAAVERTTHDVRYDGSYVSISYPLGDVPSDQGVCTDLVIRAYRALGTDLQKLIHEDMKVSFSNYPNNWGLAKPDSNIDHRRVPNMQRFFARYGSVLSVTGEATAYQAGDLVTWTVPPHLPHIGIVSALKSDDGTRPLIVHNIGRGPKLEDRLFEFPITGHYRFHELS